MVETDHGAAATERTHPRGTASGETERRCKPLVDWERGREPISRRAADEGEFRPWGQRRRKSDLPQLSAHARCNRRENAAAAAAASHGPAADEAAAVSVRVLRGRDVARDIARVMFCKAPRCVKRIALCHRSD
ncbi:unnamed protein product [Lampetra fluviatilis]